MTFIETVQRSRWPHWKDALFALIFSVIGGFFPIWLGAILVRAVNQWAGIIEFVRHGELAIYCATFLSMIIFGIARGPEKKYVTIFPVIGLVVSTGLFAVTRFNNPFDEIFVIWVTFGLLIFSVVGYFVTALVEAVRTGLDWREEQSRQINELSKRIDEMRLENEQ